LKNLIKIQTLPEYLPNRSDPTRSYYFFSYQIKITNKSKKKVQLLSRYWHITDGQGHSEDIHGPGVVGKTPLIIPGNTFQYTSFCPLSTPVGFMEGSYRMISESGLEFDVKIAPFKLMAPDLLN
tara:strand:- start:2 stop:373 length:372 start_codon:yes stop_codon:yes gene_type:complete